MVKNRNLPRAGEKHANTISHRVYYAETDRMGVVYYGNYPAWFERGRTELLRDLNLVYRQMEDDGFALPVRKMTVQYLRPAKYDELVSIVTVVTAVTRASVTFLTVIWGEDGNPLTEGEVQLACVDKSGSPTALPERAGKILKAAVWQ